MIAIGLLRMFKRANTFANKLKQYDPSVSLKTLMWDLENSQFSNVEMGNLLLFLNSQVADFSNHPELISAVEVSYNKNSIQDKKTLSIFLWLLTRKNYPNGPLVQKLCKKLAPIVKFMYPSEFCYYIEAVSNLPSPPSVETISDIHEAILRMKGSMVAMDLNVIAKYYKKIYREDLENLEVFSVFESELSRLTQTADPETILSVLSLLGVIILKHPTDLFTVFQTKFIRDCHNYSVELIDKVIRTYAALPTFHHYTELLGACADSIIKHPEAYFTSPVIYLNIAHAYSKIHSFPQVMQLFPVHLPTVPSEIINHPTHLGFFIYSILRNPPNFAYEQMVTNLLIVHSEKIPKIFKQKIVIAMLKRKSGNILFWEKIHELQVTWTEAECAYVEECREKLSRLKLIS